MDDIGALWPYATAALDIAVSAAASAHAVLHKRDSRAAVGWVGLIWLVPIAGTLLYLWLGINRIQRKARSLRAQRPHPEPQEVLPECSAEAFSAACGPEGGHLASLAQLVGDVTKRSLVAGNRVEPLENGDEAYPAMLQAIEGASRSITLCTYIFNYDRAGR
ncbi:MAG: cardiolipin synthase, partial [Planctomycetes bacterium]|nr:cardiolipin synthase [Planctomycetota bacterium]